MTADGDNEREATLVIGVEPEERRVVGLAVSEGDDEVVGAGVGRLERSSSSKRGMVAAATSSSLK